MKKINTILAAVSALLMLTVTAANSVEFKAGVSANGMAAYANAKETLKGSGVKTGRTTNEEAVLAASFASIFAEISSDELMGLGIGVSYAPEVADLAKETRHIADATGDSGNDADGGIQAVLPSDIFCQSLHVIAVKRVLEKHSSHPHQSIRGRNRAKRHHQMGQR